MDRPTVLYMIHDIMYECTTDEPLICVQRPNVLPNSAIHHSDIRITYTRPPQNA